MANLTVRYHVLSMARLAAICATAIAGGRATSGCDASNNDFGGSPDSTFSDGSVSAHDATPDDANATANDSSAPRPEASADSANAADSNAAETSAADVNPSPDANAQDAADARIDAAPSGPLAANYIDYAINHILETGQSNAVASGGRPQNTFIAGTTFTSVQPFGNLMFDSGVMTAGPKPGVPGGTNCDGSGCPAAAYRAPISLVPLIENDSFFDNGDRVETASSSLANAVSSFATTQFMFGTKAGYPTKHDVLVSMHGRSGNTYWCLRKGGCTYKPANQIRAFDEAMLQVQSGKVLAAASGKSYVVRAVTVIHGESDHYGYQDGGNEFPLPRTNGVAGQIQDYADALIEWQSDYESSIQALTGQAAAVPLLVSGLSGWTGARTSKISPMQLKAHERAPGKVVLVAPGYIFDPAIQADGQLECLHYSLRGQQHLGEYFAKAYAQIVFAGRPFEPLRPLSAQRAGNVITVKFLVPVPPLTLDTALVSSNGIANFGFDFVDNGALAPIANVTLIGPDTVTITLAGPPSGAAKSLRYALNQPIPGCMGPGVLTAGGARGNLRDADPTPSPHGFPLFNWAVPFEITVP
jgi:hypothetical protein